MSVQFEHRPYTDAQPDNAPPPAAPRPTAARTEKPAPAPEKAQRDKSHNGLIALGVFVAVVVVFVAMVVLTMLAGGDGYVP